MKNWEWFPISLTMLYWAALHATTESEEHGQLGISSIAYLPPLLEYEEKVQMGLISEEFFQFLYPKTAVTRPYILGTGLILYFLSKKINAK